MGVDLPIIRPKVCYRCTGCGKLAWPHQILPADDGPPQEDCSCWKGPRWERGVWFPEPARNDGQEAAR